MEKTLSTARVDALAPYKAVALLVVCVVGLVLIAGCGSDSGGSGPNFEPLGLSAPADDYRSKMWTVASEVRIEKSAGGLHCVVQGEPVAAKGPYGGITLPAGGARSWRFEMGFPDPEAILKVYVDAYDAKRQRVARWQSTKAAKLGREKAAYTFIPGQSVEAFQWVPSESTGPIDNIQVFVRVKPGGRASFDLYEIELAK